MTIEDMIENARSEAHRNGEIADRFWGDPIRVVSLLAAYHGGFNVGNLENHKKARHT